MRIRHGFEIFLFALWSKNDNLISAQRSGLKTGMNFRGLVWQQVWKITFFGLKYRQDLENRTAHPHQEFPGVTPPPANDLICYSPSEREATFLYVAVIL